MYRNQFLFLLFCTATLVGCGDTKTTTKNATDEASTSASEANAADANEEMNAAVILVQFRGCENADGIERDRHEAKAIAESCVAKASEGSDFYELAREYSDHPSATAGGILGNFKAKDELKPLVETTRKLKVGDISDPKETHYGYFVVMRREVEDILNASHILLRHKETPNPPAGVERTKEEAVALAKQILEEVENGGNFNLLAMQYSNGPTQKAGGQLGNFSVGQLPTNMRDVGHKVASLEINQLSEPFETDYGIHLVKRQAPPKPSILLAAKHILVMHKGSERANGVKRSKEDAFARIKNVQAKLMEGQDFSQLATEYSDCPSAEKGGDLGRFPRGQMTKKFSDALADCTVGSCTDIVETEFGYHIIYRKPLILRRN